MLDATTAEMIKLCVMAQRTKKLARNHKSAFPEKPIMPALPQHIVRCQLYPPSDLRPFQTWAAFLSCRMSFAGVGESTNPSSGLAATTSPKRKKTKCWRAITRPCSDFFQGSIAILDRATAG